MATRVRGGRMIEDGALDMLNVASHRYVRKSGNLYQHDLPEWIVDRVNRSREYSLGFTGWKADAEGMVGQFLLAVHSSREFVYGGPYDPDVRYYAVNVPYGDVVQYVSGEELAPSYIRLAPSLCKADPLVVLSNLRAIFRDGIVRLCAFVIYAEADRKPEDVVPTVRTVVELPEPEVEDVFK